MFFFLLSFQRRLHDATGSYGKRNLESATNPHFFANINILFSPDHDHHCEKIIIVAIFVNFI